MEASSDRSRKALTFPLMKQHLFHCDTCGYGFRGAIPRCIRCELEAGTPTRTCPDCNGTGSTIGPFGLQKCMPCDGTGRKVLQGFWPKPPE